VRKKDPKAMQTDHLNQFFMLLKTQSEADWLNFFYLCYSLEMLVNFRCLTVMKYIFFLQSLL
jgi:hypothetical protein